jgi:hypothetical protein
MVRDHEKQEEIEKQIAISSSKSALVERALFSAVPILLMGATYLINEVNSTISDIIQLKAKIAIVVSSDNKAIPSLSTTIDLTQIRDVLNEKIDKVEKDAALARAAMTLDRERSISAIDKSRLEMAADAAQARMQIRLDTQKLFDDLDKRLHVLEAMSPRPGASGVISINDALIPQQQSASPCRSEFPFFIRSAFLDEICSPILADWQPGQYSPDPKIQQWFRAQKNIVGDVCCDESEAVSVEDWAHEGDGYRVLINGQWYQVRKEALTASRSITGTPLAWIWPKGSPISTQTIRCFIPGPEG